MTVTSINPTGRQGPPTPARRGRRPVRQIAHLAQLSSKADQIRYACDQIASTGPVTTDGVRTWLQLRDVETDRVYTSRVVNAWREANGDPVTPPAGIPVITVTPPVAEPVTAPVLSETAPADPPPTTVAEPVTAPVALPVPLSEPTILEPPLEPAAIVVPVTAPVAPTVAVQPSPKLLRRAKRLRAASYVVLTAVAAAGAALSYQSLETAAAKVFPSDLAHMFPLLVDALIVGASLAYMAGATVGRGRPGWRLTAHAAVAGTLVLNALAATSVGAVPWHIAAPLVWSVIVELTARDLLGDHRQTVARPDSIPVALWLTAPGESAATWLRVRRHAAHESARLDVGKNAAAVAALRMALPGLSGRRARRIIARQLRAGSVTPETVLAQAVSIMGDLPAGSPKAVLRDVLAGAVTSPAKGAASTI